MSIRSSSSGRPRKLSNDRRAPSQVFSRADRRLSAVFRAGKPPRTISASAEAEVCRDKGLRVAGGRGAGRRASSVRVTVDGRSGLQRSRTHAERVRCPQAAFFAASPGKFCRMNRVVTRVAHTSANRVVTSICQPVRSVRKHTREPCDFLYSVTRYTDVSGDSVIVSVAVGDRSLRARGISF